MLGSNDVSRLDPLGSGYGLSVQLAVLAGLRLGPSAKDTVLCIWGEQDMTKPIDYRSGYSRRTSHFCFFRIY